LNLGRDSKERRTVRIEVHEKGLVHEYKNTKVIRAFSSGRLSGGLSASGSENGIVES